MKRVNLIKTASLLLLAGLLLTSCGKDAKGPDQGEGDERASQSVETSDTVDLAEIEKQPFPSLSLEEAREKYGDHVLSENGAVYGDALYYLGKLSPFGDSMTAFRYDFVTGKVEPVCQQEGCDHRGEDCPFAGVNGYSSLSVTPGGGLVFDTREKEGDFLHYYNIETGETKTYPMEPAGSGCVCTENAVYYSTTRQTDLRCFLYKVDLETGEQTCVSEASFNDFYIMYPYTIDGEDVVLLNSNTFPDGSTKHGSYTWLYKYDAATGERVSFLSDSLAIYSHLHLVGEKFLCFGIDESTEFDKVNDYLPYKGIYLCDLSTGERKLITEDPIDPELVMLTDKCVFWFRKSDGEKRDLLRCYRIDTGEITETRLQWEDDLSGIPFYAGGRVFMVNPSMTVGMTVVTNAADFIVWDVETGVRRIYRNGKFAGQDPKTP